MNSVVWHPEYSERYYAVDLLILKSLKDEENLNLAVNRYMWLDIDDDFEYLKNGLVFMTKEEAMNAAKRIWAERKQQE